MGRLPTKPYETFARQTRLDGVRIGVVREYMDKALFTTMDEETIDIVGRAAEDMKRIGADVVDPGPGGTLFGDCLRRYNPQMHNAVFTRQFPDLFPVDKNGAPAADHIATLVAMAEDPSLVPALSLRDLGEAPATGESRYMMNRYLAERGDSEIKSNADLVVKSRLPRRPAVSRPQARSRASRGSQAPRHVGTALLKRFAVQQIVLQCMTLQGLDAVIYPTSNLPPPKLGAPAEPSVNGRGNSWSMLGRKASPRSPCRPGSRPRCTTASATPARRFAPRAAAEKRPLPTARTSWGPCPLRCRSAWTSSAGRSTSRRSS